MGKGALAALLLCSGLARGVADRYVCDTVDIEAVAETVLDIDYDQRKQQTEIDGFNGQLDGLLALAEGNNTCGAEEFHNIDSSLYSVLLGGCENDIFIDADWSAVGGGQKNWAYTGAELVAINGGMHNIGTGDWTAIGGGVKNKAYSNYATVIGGYLNKASSKFATVLGGSRNTCSGRYSVAMGYKTKVTSDFAIGLGFSGADCFIRGANTFGACTTKFIVSGTFGDFDLVAELGARRQLGEVTKQVDDIEAENAALEATLRSKIADLLGSGRVSAQTASAVSRMLTSLA